MLLVAFFSLAAPAGVGAAERTGSVTDPRDQSENLSGQNRPDLASIEARYDQADGQLVISASFYEPLSVTRPGYGFQIKVGSAYATGYDHGKCNPTQPGDLTLNGSIDPNSTAESRLSVSGYEGSLAVTRDFSPDGKRVDFIASHHSLVNREYRCAAESALSTYYYGGYSGSSYGEDTAPGFAFAGLGPPPRPACSDGIDNEGDGESDFPDDTDCSSETGSSEGAPPGECDDGKDNDGDGDYDYDEDMDCDDYDDPTEAPPPPRCRNGVDDDGDGRVDLKDPGCVLTGAEGNSEADRPHCSDGIDNDGDGRMDMRDAQCVKRTQTTESKLPRIPSLTRAQAIRYARVALKRKFKGAWTYRYGGRVACRPSSRLRQRCRIAFGIGDSTWSGVVRIWYGWEDKQIWWYWSMNVVRVDEYCLATRKRGRSACRHRIVVR